MLTDLTVLQYRLFDTARDAATAAPRLDRSVSYPDVGVLSVRVSTSFRAASNRRVSILVHPRSMPQQREG